MARPLSRQHFASEIPPHHAGAAFYREEFLKHLTLLRMQRGCFSEGAVSSAEQALARILTQLDALCAKHDADEVCSRLLASFDCVTGASWLCERERLH